MTARQCDVCGKLCTRIVTPGVTVIRDEYTLIELVWWNVGDGTVYVCNTCWKAAMTTLEKVPAEIDTFLMRAAQVARTMVKLARAGRAAERERG